jgi:hypothetical protein
MAKQDDPVKQNQNAPCQKAADDFVGRLGGTGRVKKVEAELIKKADTQPAPQPQVDLSQNGRERRSLADEQPKRHGNKGPQRGGKPRP